MNDYEAARSAARANAENLIEKFRDGFHRDTGGWRLERADEEFLAQITQRKICGRALLSNEHVRRRAQYAMIDAALDAYRAHPERQWLWITVCWDRGVTWEREPHIDVMSLRRIVYGHLERCGLHGFGIIEVDTWKNLTGESGRRMVAHSHFLGYPADGGSVSIKRLESELCQRRALENSISARSVVIEPMTLAPADFAWIGQYMFKCPAYAKRPVPRENGGGIKLVGAEHAQGSVARLVEVLSRLEVGDVMFSIGGGSEIAKKVRAGVAHEIRDRRSARPAPTRDEGERHWRRIREMNGSKLFREPKIVTRKEDRVRETDRWS